RKASIHYHFATKADLGLALIGRYAERFFATLADIRHSDGSAAEQLRSYVQIYRDALAEGDQVCLCVALSAGRDSLSTEVLDQLNRFHTDSIAWLTEVFERAAQDGSVSGCALPIEDATAALALVEGAQLLARARKDASLFDQALAALIARLATHPVH
ncbi:MAG: TetR/AcrR family transcriptional regulator, partial [Pseudomonadota bacterium]